MLSDIARFRRINRAVTTLTGAMDQSFLGRGRSLGAARVLNAIGHGRTDVGDIRDYLQLDSGLMSRFLRGLEDEGLISTKPSKQDARRRMAMLTAKGRAEVQAYEELSNEGAREVLGRYKQRELLLQAIDLVATVLGRDQIEISEVDPEDSQIKACMEIYYAEIAAIFETGFDPANASPPDAEDMRPPNGIFLMAKSDALPVGCVAMKGERDAVGEIRRMWVSPAARGLGLARQLMQEIESRARTMGIAKLRLDTSGKLIAARRLYESSGWREIERYNDNIYADYFFEKIL